MCGDPHLKIEELADCTALFDLIEQQAAQHQPDYVILLGDQYNDHAVLRVELLEFLTQRLARIVDALEPSHAGGNRVIAIVGNHDQPGGKGLTAHAMLAHKHQRGVTVVDKPWGREDVCFLPYYGDDNAFYAACEERAQMGFTGLVCHQSFKGAYYENGQKIGGDVYMPDGLDLEKVPQKWVISGHIHKPQRTGKLWYPGAPRWRSASDANEDRAIHLVEFGRSSELVGVGDEYGYRVAGSFDTSAVCRPLRHVVITPEHSLVPRFDDHTRWLVDIHGPVDFVEARKKELSGLGLRIRTYPERAAAIHVVKESEGIGRAFEKHLGAYTPKFGTDKSKLSEMAKTRMGGLCSA